MAEVQTLADPFARRLRRRLRTEAQLLPLRVSNVVSRARLTDHNNECVVSLTTHGRRTRSAYLAIESIGRGTARPARIILWLDDPALFASPPRTLRRLARRGLEIRECAKMGPHAKYFPFVSSEPPASPLVTADDDVLYPPHWLADLVASYNSAPELLHCHRAHQVVVTGDGLAPYAIWPACRSSAPSLLHFATAVAGVAHPPRLQLALRERATAFLQTAPRADDVWVHATCVVEGIAVKQVRDDPAELTVIPGTFHSALMTANLVEGGNDRQIVATYSSQDVDRLRRCTQATSPSAEAW